MSSTVLITVVSLFALSLAAAVILYFISQKFKVEEDPRIDQVQEQLPGANCGGCGFAGCRNFAEACVKAENLENLLCPVGGSSTMSKIGSLLGMEVAEAAPKVATLKCAGSAEYREKTTNFDGVHMCRLENMMYSGETECSFGFLGYGDCVNVCNFDAITLDPIKRLPVFDEEKCKGCNACVKACPKGIIELRKKGPKGKKIYVACSNCDKGGVARKACKVACIGCGKCTKVCNFEAITVTNNVAYIDAEKCKMCRKCVAECPQGCIIEVGFPPRKPKEETMAAPAPEIIIEKSASV